jgi:DNA-binding transcriptional LysR family regulator
MSSLLAQHFEVVRSMAALVAVAEHGSLVKAARELGLTASAMSKLLSRTEARLGAKLLERSTRKVQLTEAGHGYLEHARRVLVDLEATERSFEERDPAPRGTLRVTAPLALGQVRIAPLVLEYRAAHPDVQVQLDLTDRKIDLIEERVDVAIRITDAPPESLVARRLDDHVRVLCASPAYLRRHGTPERVEDLAQHACLALIVGGEVVPWPLQERAGPRKLRALTLNSPLAMSSPLSLREAALFGAGIADLPRYLIDQDLAAGRLVPVLEPEARSTRGVYVLYAQAPVISAKIRSFVEHLRTHYKKSSRAR